MEQFNLNKVLSYAAQVLGRLYIKGLYIILLMYYAYKEKDTPAWAKRTILGAMAYFVSPLDSIPDLTPYLGMTDDLAVLSFGLVGIACYINDEVRSKARKRLIDVLKTAPEKIIAEVDSWL